MEIGKAIKQKTFKNSFTKAIINILYTSSHLDVSMARTFKTKGIQKQHFNILRIIKGSHPNPVNPGYIKEVMLDKGRDLTRLLDKMEKLGYIRRKSNPQNRRSLNITLTDIGEEVETELSQMVEDWYKRHTALNEEEAEALSNLLDKLRGGLQ